VKLQVPHIVIGAPSETRVIDAEHVIELPAFNLDDVLDFFDTEPAGRATGHPLWHHDPPSWGMFF
jgi:hypothetical protein